MKHFGKLFTVVAVLLLLVVVFVGCGSKSDTTTKNNQTTDPTTSTTPGQTTTTAPISTESPTVGPIPPCEEHTPSEAGTYCTTCYTILENKEDYKNMLYFACDDETITKAYQIAIADCAYNLKPISTADINAAGTGLIKQGATVIYAGGSYDSLWTRDTSINVWNAFSLLNREAAKNSLLAALRRDASGYYIGHQYWDCIIWTIGAYQYIIVSEDTEFLELAQKAVTNSLARLERDEFDPEDGLFRGPAVYGDGIAAYPDKYTNTGGSGIMGWVNIAGNEKAPNGYGIPMKALSTNCTYYQSYVLLAKMNEMLGLDSSDATAKAAALKKAINDAFWNEEKGTYDYLAYECDYQEAFGISFALMFGIADERQAALVLQNTVVTEQGIACVWPSFDRYLELGGYGRHAGVVWPHAQGFWGQACDQYGYGYGFEHELLSMAERAVANGQFHEIYHPDTGEVYGGLQGDGYMVNIHEWGSVPHQTWSATAYLSLVYYHIVGAEIGEKTVTFTPYLPTGVNEATINGMQIGSTTFNVIITRGGNTASTATYDTTAEGTVTVHLSVK